MTNYVHDQVLVADAASFTRAPNTQVTVYDIADNAEANPLALADLRGVLMSNPLTSSADAFTPAFVTTSPQVKLVGGGLSVLSSSYMGLKEDAEAAKEASETAAAAAQAAVDLAQAPTDAQVDAGIDRADIPAQVGAVVPGLVNAAVPPIVAPLVADAIANDPTVAASAANMAQSTAGLVPVWKASTAYTAGQRVIAPNGDIVSAKVNFTSAAAYNATNWNPSTDGSTLATIFGRELPDRGRALAATYPSYTNITARGSWQIWTAGDAVSMGFPFAAAGRARVYPIGSSLIMEYTTLEIRPRKAISIFNGTIWQPWASGTNRFVGDIPNTVGALQALTIDGDYTVPSGTVAATVGLLDPSAGVIRRYTYGAANYVRLEWLPAGSFKEFVQHYTGTWGAWGQKNASATAAADVLPAYAGVRTKTWDRFTKLFNGESDHVRRIRNGINGARFKNKPYRLVFLGDSKTAGAGIQAPGRADTNSVPAQVMDALGAADGFIYAGNAYAGWTIGAGFDLAAQYDKHYRVNTAGVSGSITLFTIRPFTGYTLYAQSDAGATITATVDGGAPTVHTIPAGAGWQAVPVIGLGNTNHTVVFTTTSGVKLLGVDLKHTDNLFTVTNAGRSGSTAGDWALTGPYDLFNTGAGVIAPDAVVVNIGTNTGASVDADITTVINKCATLGVPVVVAAFGGIASSAPYDSKRLTLYGAADTNDLPLIDYTAVIGNYDVANAAGLMNDTLHENQRGYSLEAEKLLRVVTP